jgi:hypothetical protein
MSAMATLRKPRGLSSMPSDWKRQLHLPADICFCDVAQNGASIFGMSKYANRIFVDHCLIRDLLSAALFEQNPNPGSDRAHAKHEILNLTQAVQMPSDWKR